MKKTISTIAAIATILLASYGCGENKTYIPPTTNKTTTSVEFDNTHAGDTTVLNVQKGSVSVVEDTSHTNASHFSVTFDDSLETELTVTESLNGISLKKDFGDEHVCIVDKNSNAFVDTAGESYSWSLGEGEGTIESERITTTSVSSFDSTGQVLYDDSTDVVGKAVLEKIPALLSDRNKEYGATLTLLIDDIKSRILQAQYETNGIRNLSYTRDGNEVTVAGGNDSLSISYYDADNSGVIGDDPRDRIVYTTPQLSVDMTSNQLNIDDYANSRIDVSANRNAGPWSAQFMDELQESMVKYRTQEYQTALDIIVSNTLKKFK